MKQRLSEQFALSDLDQNAISDITAEFLFDREHGSGMNQNYVNGISIRNGFLYIQYKTMPTYDDENGHERVNAVPASVPTDYYDTLFQTADILEVVSDQATLKSFSAAEQMKLIRDFLENGSSRVWCSCGAFYYQGHYEQMAAHDSTVFPFRGPKGDGIWAAKHSPGLTQPGVSICKHIAACIHNILGRDLSKILKQLLKELPAGTPVEVAIAAEPVEVAPVTPEEVVPTAPEDLENVEVEVATEPAAVETVAAEPEVEEPEPEIEEALPEEVQEELIDNEEDTIT